MNSAWRLPPLLPANTNSNYGSVRQTHALKQDFGHEMEKKFTLRVELFSKAMGDAYVDVYSHFVCPESSSALTLHGIQESSAHFFFYLFPP